MEGWCLRGVIPHPVYFNVSKSATLWSIVLGLFYYSLMKQPRFSTRFKSKFLLGQPKHSTASWHSRFLILAVYHVAPSYKKMAGPAAGVCQSVAQHECWGPCKNSAKYSWLPCILTSGSLQLWESDHNTMTDASLWAYRSWTLAEWKRLRGHCLMPLGFAWWGLHGEDTLCCPCRDIKDSTNGCSFLTCHSSPNLSHHWASVILIVTVRRQYNTDSQMEWTVRIYVPLFCNYYFDCHKNWVGVSILRYRNFHKNTRSLTESYKSPKTNLILKNNFVSYLECSIHWVKHLTSIFVLQNCCTPTPLICLQIWNHSSN